MARCCLAAFALIIVSGGKAEAGELDTNRIKTMSSTVSALLLRNLHGVFGEIDPARPGRQDRSRVSLL